METIDDIKSIDRDSLEDANRRLDSIESHSHNARDELLDILDILDVLEDEDINEEIQVLESRLDEKVNKYNSYITELSHL